MKAKVIERPIGCIERGLDCVLYRYEQEPDLKKLLGFLQTKAFGRSRIKLEAGKTKDGKGIYIQFWKSLRSGWRILAHFEITPIEEVHHEEDDKTGTCEGAPQEAGKTASKEVGKNGNSGSRHR